MGGSEPWTMKSTSLPVLNPFLDKCGTNRSYGSLQPDRGSPFLRRNLLRYECLGRVIGINTKPSCGLGLVISSSRDRMKEIGPK